MPAALRLRSVLPLLLSLIVGCSDDTVANEGVDPPSEDGPTSERDAGSRNDAGPRPEPDAGSTEDAGATDAGADAAPSSANDIVTFTVLSNVIQPDGTDIKLELPAGTDRTALVPTIVHTGVSISPASGVPQDFTAPVTYTVAAENGATKAYTVALSVEQGVTKEINSFTVGATAGVIVGNDITLTLSPGTDVTALRPVIDHSGVVVDPRSETPQDFTQPVVYTVTGTDASTRRYTVTVRRDGNLVVAPRVVVVPPGQSSNLGLRLLDVLGAPIPNAVYTFRNTVPDVASVSPVGVVNGLLAGATRLDVGSAGAEGATTWVAVRSVFDLPLGQTRSDSIAAADGFSAYGSQEGLPTTSYYADVYRLALQPGPVTITTDTANVLNSYLMLVDANGFVAAVNDDDEDGALGVGSKIPYVVPTAGTYFLEVSTLGELDTGVYKVTATQ